MDEVEGGSVEPGDLKDKLNRLSARYVTEPKFRQDFYNPDKREDILKGLDFSDDEIKALGPGINKIGIGTLSRHGLSVDELVRKLTGSSDKPGKTE